MYDKYLGFRWTCFKVNLFPYNYTVIIIPRKCPWKLLEKSRPVNKYFNCSVIQSIFHKNLLYTRYYKFYRLPFVLH